jgi:hypothetical protein
MALITLIMLVVFLVTSFQHAGTQGPAPTPYNFPVTFHTVTPAATP